MSVIEWEIRTFGCERLTFEDLRQVRKLGFSFSTNSGGITVPPGWVLQKWQGVGSWCLIDGKGRIRGGLMPYPLGSFGDLNLNTRYTVERNSSLQRDPEERIDIVDHGIRREVIHKIAYQYKLNADGTPKVEGTWDEYLAPEIQAKQWLDEHYPNWRDPSAYWDDPEPPTPSTST